MLWICELAMKWRSEKNRSINETNLIFMRNIKVVSNLTEAAIIMHLMSADSEGC